MTQVTIQSLGQRGEGIALLDEQRIFVPLSVPGDIIDIAVSDDRGTIVQVMSPGPGRIEPFCPHFSVCGGCALQHLSPGLYADFKRGLVEAPLRHAGVDVPVNDLVDARGRGRRRATLHVRKAGAGYMARRSHDLAVIDTCPILVPGLKDALALAASFHPIAGDCDVSLTAADNGIDIALKTERKIRVQDLARIAEKFDVARIAINGEVLLQLRVPKITMGKSEVELPPASFLQATEEAEAILGDLVLKGLGKSKSVADLFCGMGPFALRIAQKGPVYAADADKPAIAALQKAIRSTKGIKAITAERRDLFREPMTRFELNRFDAIVLDPPRAGAEAQVKELARTKIATVVYVSCDPKTFARDAAHLIQAGYKLGPVTPVDQFAYSTHVELVGTFTR